MIIIPELPSEASTLDWALAYAKAGIYVLPVKQGTKNPGSVVGMDWQQGKSSIDPKQIAAWFAASDHDIALDVGRSGLVALDVDHPELKPEGMYKQLNIAAYQASRDLKIDPGRGHYLFEQPEGRRIGCSTGRLGGKWGQVRGVGGVIMAQPSSHCDGGEYRWIRTAIPVLPDALASKLDDAGHSEASATPAEVQEFIDRHTAAAVPSVMSAWRKIWADHMLAGDSRHDSAKSVVVGALKEAAAGLFSAQAFLDWFEPEFITAKTRPPINGEFQMTASQARSKLWGSSGIIAWAVGQARTADVADTLERTHQKTPSPVLADHMAATHHDDSEVPMTKREQAHKTFTKWLGKDYDTDALDAELAALAVEKFEDGSDPIWLLLISGSGNAKTEAVQATAGAGAIVTSSISSDAALLSATPKRERTKASSGGLLRLIGGSGVLAIKDVTSILSMNRDLRAKVLAALREVYDGRWTRDVGSDGGQRIEWSGRIAVIGAVTTAWDTAHGVVSAMGDRFVLIRMDSTEGRAAAGRKAIGNTGSEPTMRAELAAAVADVIAGMNKEPITVSDDEVETLLAAADLVTLARTAVEFDYRGDVIDAHAPEMPTRFAKQLTQIVRGAVAVGMDRADALRLAIRCARDSMPPLRLAIIEDLADHPASSPSDVRRRIDKPWATVDRQLQALHMLGIAVVDEVGYGGKSRWFYSLSPKIDPGAIRKG